MASSVRALEIPAPAKINLYLHVTGRRADGYHELDSLAAFADAGDIIRIAAADNFSFSVSGPFAHLFSAQEKDSGPESRNIVVRAAYMIANAAERKLNVRVELVKNLPLAAGLGGGSADAAAVVKGLLQFWKLAPDRIPDLDKILLSLGADVPVCFAGRAVRMQGIGEQLMPFSSFGSLPVVLVNPGKTCPTADVFSRYKRSFRNPAILPGNSPAAEDFIAFLLDQGNDLADAAISMVPEIAAALDLLRNQEGCRFARMSGSGATCFGIFRSAPAARSAAVAIGAIYPAWWSVAGILNRD